MVVRQVLDSGVRLVTEAIPHVRSVSLGVWLTRGSRHEQPDTTGMAHFVEHMLFKGTATRSAEDIAQAIDSIGGQLDAFTSKEYAGYYIKVLDEHLPLAVDLLADLVLRPAFDPAEIEREKKVILEEIKMVEDTPDDLVHEIFTSCFWSGHALGRPILGTPDSVGAFTGAGLRQYFERTYTAPHLIVAAAGHLEHQRVADLFAERFDAASGSAPDPVDGVPPATPQVVIRQKDLEQSHVCVGLTALPQRHDDRYVAYLLNTMLGGSMSSRLFQNVREKRGLAYSVFSGLSAYSDTGLLTVYAGCADEAVAEVVDLVVEELRGFKRAPVPDAELRRAKDHLKGSLMLSLENTSSRMSHLARQDIYFDRHYTLDETLEGIERVTPDDVQRVASTLFADGALGATVLSAAHALVVDPSRLDLE
jgi:predicted Zn-dependent peptidase